jgi:hypothetical protein
MRHSSACSIASYIVVALSLYGSATCAAATTRHLDPGFALRARTEVQIALREIDPAQAVQIVDSVCKVRTVHVDLENPNMSNVISIRGNPTIVEKVRRILKHMDDTASQRGAGARLTPKVLSDFDQVDEAIRAIMVLDE